MTEIHAGATGDAQTPPPDFPMPRDARCPLAPPPKLLTLMDSSPLVRVRVWDGSHPWLVTRHADQRALLGDPRVSSDASLPGFPHQSPGVREAVSRRRTFLNMDGPDHVRARRMIAGAFTTKRVETLRPAIQKVVDDVLDQMLLRPQPVDLVSELALPVSSLVICRLLGVPYGDHRFFERNSGIRASRTASAAEVRDANASLIDYLERQLDAKSTDPTEDLLSTLAIHVGNGAMELHLAAETALLLLASGHETTAAMISLGVLAMLDHPDQLALLGTTPDPALVASTVEELLRYLSVTQVGRRRVATADIAVAGQTIPVGDGIILPTSTANWDPELFPNPAQLNIQANPGPHLAFGFGPHQCVGQTLARVELQVVYETLFRRLPNLSLATSLDRLRFTDDSFVYSPRSLPVAW